jgi:signal transduction histidine kinase
MQPEVVMSLILPFPKYEHPLRILVVDDQAFDRQMIRARLTEVMPFDTTIVDVETAAEAIQAIQGGTEFHCVLLDMNLPDMHGVDLTAMMLSLKPALAIIIITIEADMEKALRCLKAGAEDFIIKGEYSNEGLHRALRYAIERHRTAYENLKLQQDLEHERELSSAQKEFIHLVSHEFRTPIAIISGAVQLMAAKWPDLMAGEGAPQVKKIEQAVTRLCTLLDNVVRLSMIEDGKLVFQPTEFNLSELVQQVVDQFQDARLDPVVMPQNLLFTGDRRLLEYALQNLINNALKYSPKDRQVTVQLLTEEREIVLRVIDRGAGISPQILARIGEKFLRDSGTSTNEGVGLGLHLTKRFAEYHRGTLHFDSISGEQTIATLRFPQK